MARFNPSVYHSILRLWRDCLYIGIILSILGPIKNCKCEYWNNPSSGYGNVNENIVSDRNLSILSIDYMKLISKET